MQGELADTGGPFPHHLMAHKQLETPQWVCQNNLDRVMFHMKVAGGGLTRFSESCRSKALALINAADALPGISGRHSQHSLESPKAK